MTMRRAAVSRIMFASTAIVAISSCYALRSTSPCEVDTDCERGTFCARDGSYCRTGGPIAVGILVPSTGNQASTAPDRLDGIRFGKWIIERDPTRRVLGRSIEFVIEDTLSTEEEARRAAERLVARNVVAAIGPGASTDVLEAQKVTFAARIIHLAPTAGASAVGDAQGSALAQRFLFQLSTEITNGSIQAVPLFFGDASRPATYDVCYDGMAIVVTDDATGTSYEDGLTKLLPPNCVPITRVVKTPTDKKADYAPEVDALATATNGLNKKTRCLLISTRPDVAGELLRTLASRERTSAEPYSAFLGSSLLNAPSFFDEAKSPIAGRPSLAEGFYGFDGDSAPPSATARELRELFEMYKEAYPDVAKDAVLGSQRAVWAEAVILIALAIELAGTASDPIALRDALIDLAQPAPGDLAFGPKQLDIAFARIRAARADGKRAALDYRGAQSNYDFDERGFIRLPAQVWRAIGGKIEERWLNFDEGQLASVTRDPRPACARKPR